MVASFPVRNIAEHPIDVRLVRNAIRRLERFPDGRAAVYRKEVNTLGN